MMTDGMPCSHPGCLSHILHPCEGCGRIAGHTIKAEVLQAQRARKVWSAETVTLHFGSSPSLELIASVLNIAIADATRSATPHPPAPCQCADPEQIIALRHAADTAEAQARENVELCAKVAYYEAQMCLPDNPLIAIPSGYTAQVAARSVSPERVADVITQRDELRAEVERLTTATDALTQDRDEWKHAAGSAQTNWYVEKELVTKQSSRIGALNDTIAQQAERIAELEEENIQRLETSCQQHAKIMAQAALIEKCEKALEMIATCKAGNLEDECCSCENGYSPEYEAKQALAALAAQKGGSD